MFYSIFRSIIIIIMSSEETLFEDMRHRVESLIGTLTCKDDYCSQGACDAIASLKAICYYLWYDANHVKISGRLVDYMLDKGLQHLLVNIVKSTGKYTVNFRCDAGLVITHLVVNMENTNKSAADKVEMELIKCGMIGELVKELDTYDPNTNDPKQILLITSILYDLDNLGSAPNVIPIYRSANAVSILTKFAEAINLMTRIDSLRTLAFIINEEESVHISSSGDCISTLLDITHKAAQSDEREYVFVINVDGEEKEFAKPLGPSLETIINLANNDANKEAIVQHGGLPILTEILSGPYREDTAQWKAAGALWKLSFLESIQDDIKDHLENKDRRALQGKYQASLY